MSTFEDKVALITGSSTGIGYNTSLYLARRGFYVYATMRDISKAGPLLEVKEREDLPLQVLRLDVTDENGMVDAVATVVREKGRIDVLVNNAGFALEGSVEEVSSAELRSQFETNFFGLVRLTQGVVPIMRRRGSGYIVNISSVGGRIAIPFMGAYCASKFAVEGLSESLYHELHKFGIHVIIIEPSYTQTRFSKNVLRAKKSMEDNSPYATSIKEARSGHKKGIDPDRVAEVIYHAITSGRPRLRYTVGLNAWADIFLRRLIPERLFLWGVRRRYPVD